MKRSAAAQPTGLAGPVAIFGGLLLLVLSPILRGSDYYFAMIPMEALGIAIIAALALRHLLAHAGPADVRAGFDARIAWLLASPLLLALFQLVPMPSALWSQLPGHARYAEALAALGLDSATWRPASISPSATRASLLVWIPLAASFLLGYLANLAQIRSLLRAVAVMAFLEVLIGLLQLSGGERSPFYFGMQTYGSPIGSLGTRNEYANFLAVALGGYIWLAYDAIRYSIRWQPGAPLHTGRFDHRHALAAWVLGGLVLVVGILISRSRAGAAFGLSAAILAAIAAGLRSFGFTRGWRVALALLGLLVIAAVAMVGVDLIGSRISGAQLQSAAGFRGELWEGSIQTALQFLPFGSGWGTYDIAYRPFQTAGIVGYPNHAHNDYIEGFVEGGLLFAAAAGLAAWLLAARAAGLMREVRQGRTLDRQSMMSLIAGIALAGFLLHAAVDFPMRVPANAILACLMAGIFLRPARDPQP